MNKLKEVVQNPRKKRESKKIKEKKSKKNVIIVFDPNKIILNWD